MFRLASEANTVLRQGLAILLLTLPLPFLCEYSGLDVWLVNLYFDSATLGFPWRRVAWFEAVMHGGIKTLLVIFLALVIVAFLISLFAPGTLKGILPPFWQRRRVLGYLIVAMLAGPGLIGLLKHNTTHHCPWHLVPYGGQFPYLHLWQEPFFNRTAPGLCFPGGHASGGYALLALVPLLQGRAQMLAWMMALGLGTVMGWSRMMQGAHFLSHNLWSAWVCGAATLLCFALLQPLLPQETPPPEGDSVLR